MLDTIWISCCATKLFVGVVADNAELLTGVWRNIDKLETTASAIPKARYTGSGSCIFLTDWYISTVANSPKKTTIANWTINHSHKKPQRYQSYLHGWLNFEDPLGIKPWQQQLLSGWAVRKFPAFLDQPIPGISLCHYWSQDILYVEVTA